MKKTFILFLLFTFSFASFGAYLKNIPTQLVQPNGEVLDLFITGDEFFRRVHDSDGYTIVPGADGWYYYALYDAETDELVPSGFVVTASRNFELPMAKELGISHEKYIEKRRAFFEPTGCDVSGASKRSILDDLAQNDSKETQQMNNIIICIGFSDTQNMTHNFSYVNGMFNTDANNNLKNYFLTMSYNQLEVTSHFYPPENGNVLRFYKDSQPRAYYQPYSASNPQGYQNSTQSTTREHTLLRNAINWVNANYPVPTTLNLDINNDGECDFITFVVQGPVGNWSDLLWPHKWNLYTTPYVYINGKRVNTYNFELDGSSNYFNVGTFCHEGFHCLGAPDLYHYNNNQVPIGVWDIMASTASKPQSMSAYMKLKYGKWLYNNNYTHTNFPAATINFTYEIFPFYTNNGTDPAKPIMYRIPMTGVTNQYSLVEYRKKTGANYETALPNEGLLIYRINTSWNGNAQHNGSNVLDEVFIYRPGSTQSTNYTTGTINQAPFNSSNGRTAFNSTTDPKPYFSNGNAETTQNINNILYDNVTDSYTFFYGNPSNRNMSLDKTELQLANLSGSTGTVSITSNVLWRIYIPSAAAGWLAVSKTKGLNSETVTFTTLSGNTGSPRSAVVTFTGNGQTFDVDITQLGETSTECYPATNLVVNYTPDCNAQLTWNAPTGKGATNAYNIYRDNVLIKANHTTTSYTDDTFDPWVGHAWTVKVVCTDGESDPVSVNKAACSVFVPVTNITNVPATTTVGTPLTLTGTVVPSNASNQTIVWSIQSAGTTGATISGNILNTTASGTATLLATIANGIAIGNNYTQLFTVTVNKNTQEAPAAPTLLAATATSITLNTIAGCEYRRDGGAWQTSTTFTGLIPNTPYTFEAYKPETTTHLASPVSPSAIFSTNKPTLTGSVTISGNLVFGETLTANTNNLTSDPSDFSLGTLTFQWKRGTTIIGTDNQNYTLAQADIGNTITVTVSAANCDGDVTSVPTAIVTKAPQTDPDAPTLETKTTTNITLSIITGCEYRKDAGEWQISTIFNNLTPNTQYQFDARKAETETHFASQAGPAATFITDLLGVDDEFSNVKIYSYQNSVYIHNKTQIALKSVEILDMVGRLVYQTALTDIETEINLNVMNGIYTVKLISHDDKTTMRKVAIMKL